MFCFQQCVFKIWICCRSWWHKFGIIRLQSPMDIRHRSTYSWQLAGSMPSLGKPTLVSIFVVSNFGLKGATGSSCCSLFLGKWHSYESMTKAINMYSTMENIDVATFIKNGRSQCNQQTKIWDNFYKAENKDTKKWGFSGNDCFWSQLQTQFLITWKGIVENEKRFFSSTGSYTKTSFSFYTGVKFWEIQIYFYSSFFQILKFWNFLF